MTQLLPSKLVKDLLKKRGPKQNLVLPALAADLYDCNPYCEKAGQVYYSDPKSYPEGLAVSPEPGKDLKSVGAHLRWILAATPEFVATHAGDNPDVKPPLSAAAMPDAALSSTIPPIAPAFVPETRESSARNQTGKSDSGPTTGGTGQGTQQGTQPLLATDLGAALAMGARSNSTTSNTQVETGAGLRPLYKVHLGAQMPALLEWNQGFIDGRFRVSYLEGFSETSPEASARLLSSNELEFRAGSSWTSRAHGYSLGPILGYRHASIFTTEDSARGFSTSTGFMLFGLNLEVSRFRLEVLRSLIGQVRDADQFRGTSVSGGFWEVSGRYCLGTQKDGKTTGQFFYALCPEATFNVTSETGSGTPHKAVFTVNPTHQYISWRLGLQFVLSRLWSLE